MKILKNILLVFVVIIISYTTASYFGTLYGGLFAGAGSVVNVESLMGLFSSYVFFLASLFYSFCGEEKTKWWWIGIGLIPAFVGWLILDPYRIYFPIILGLLGWLIGLGIRKLIDKFKVNKLES